MCTRLVANEATRIAHPLHLYGAGEGVAVHRESTSCRISLALPSTKLLWRSKEGLTCGLLFHEGRLDPPPWQFLGYWFPIQKAFDGRRSGYLLRPFRDPLLGACNTRYHQNIMERMKAPVRKPQLQQNMLEGQREPSG